MGRSNYQFKDGVKQRKKRELNAVWRGVGFIILVALAVGGYWLAGNLLDRNVVQPFLPFRVPVNMTIFLIHWLPADQAPPFFEWVPKVIPARPVIQVATALLLDILAFSVMVLLYSIVNPIRKGPTDADQPRGRGRRSLVR
ncbi:MAG: hypothetical protein IT317_16655 [Anaerolineales bacterium]|nr:hypothetical protein [Anaerolineales bacterium]